MFPSLHVTWSGTMSPRSLRRRPVVENWGGLAMGVAMMMPAPRVTSVASLRRVFVGVLRDRVVLFL